MGHFIYQFNEKGCALASFQMLLANNLHSKSYLFAKCEKHPPNSLLSLEKAAEKYNVTLSFYQCEDEGFDYPFKKKKGFLALLKGKECPHLVYIKRISRHYVYYYDPNSGRKREKKEEFQKRYAKVFGVLENEKKAKKPIRNRCFSFYDVFFLYLVPILANFSLICGFYYFNRLGNLLYPSFSFIAFAFFSLTSFFLKKRLAKKMDEAALKPLSGYENEELNVLFKDFQTYKKFLLGTFPNAVSSFLSGIAYSFIVSMNNLYFLLPLLSSLSLYFAFSLLTKNKEMAKIEEVNALEKSLISSNDKENILKEISEKSLLFMQAKETERIVLAVSLLASSLLSLLGASNISLNYYLFHFFSLVSAFLLLKNIFDLSFNKDKITTLESKMNEYLRI